MATLDEHFRIDRCPHCSIDNPNLSTITGVFRTTDDRNQNSRVWNTYVCKRCGGAVLAWRYENTMEVQKYYPSTTTLDQNLPSRVLAYLQQAIDSSFAPAGSVMLSASAVDAMLKEKGYKEGSLYARINKASTDALLTKEMATWAHQVRLEANDQRHSDEEAELPTVEDAKQAIEFAKTLAEFLFVLPAKVTRGIESSKHEDKPKGLEKSSPGAKP